MEIREFSSRALQLHREGFVCSFHWFPSRGWCDYNDSVVRKSAFRVSITMTTQLVGSERI